MTGTGHDAEIAEIQNSRDDLERERYSGAWCLKLKVEAASKQIRNGIAGAVRSIYPFCLLGLTLL